MATAHFVKKARKTHRGTGIKKGDSYYWWKFRYGSKHYSKTEPKASQLTQSEFLSTVYEIQERFEDIEPTTEALAEARDMRDDAVDELRSLADEQSEKHDNMPDSLQDSETGQLLENRMDSCNEFADDLEGVDLDIERDADESEEDFTQRIQYALEELATCSYSGD